MKRIPRELSEVPRTRGEEAMGRLGDWESLKSKAVVGFLVMVGMSNVVLGSQPGLRS